MEKEIGWYKGSADQFFCLGCSNAENMGKEGCRLIKEEDLKNDIYTCDKCGKVFPESENVCGHKPGETAPGLEQKNIAAEDPVKPGISGWLILLAIVLLVIPFFYLYSLIDYISIFKDGSWELITNPNSSYYVFGMREAMIFEIVFQILAFFFSFYLLFLFFKKDRRFPKFYIIYVAVCLVYGIIGFAVLSLLLNPSQIDSTDLQRAVISSSVWIPYMLKSKQVKKTFINL